MFSIDATMLFILISLYYLLCGTGILSLLLLVASNATFFSKRDVPIGLAFIPLIGSLCLYGILTGKTRKVLLTYIPIFGSIYALKLRADYIKKSATSNKGLQLLFVGYPIMKLIHFIAIISFLITLFFFL